MTWKFHSELSIIMTKPCIDCKVEKPFTEFYANYLLRGGVANVCKECHRLRMKVRRRSNPSVQEYERKRAKLPDRKRRSREVVIKWRKENPDGYKAHTILGNAVRDGKINKQPCAVCGDSKVHAHHEDYSKPLDVIWLCALHHHRGHADGVIG